MCNSLGFLVLFKTVFVFAILTVKAQQLDLECYQGCINEICAVKISPLKGTAVKATRFRDYLSIRDFYAIEKGENWSAKTDKINDIGISNQICSSSKSAQYKERVTSAIEKVLVFYQHHRVHTNHGHAAAKGLLFLKDADDKYGKRFENGFEISKWIQEACNDVVFRSNNEFCTKMTTTWRQSKARTWKSGHFNMTERHIEAVGHEKEQFWRPLNGHCQVAIVNRCEIPHVCKKTLYDPVPRSQYYLTHQLLQQILTEHAECPQAKTILNENVNDQLCFKMYQEAQLISEMDYPESLRDVFLEYIAFCGYMGYTNFFREDWIENLLSWQSSSEYGCFGYGEQFKSKFWTDDNVILRRQTLEEKENGVEPNDECRTHLTTVALSALSVIWDYMEENCYEF